MSHTLVIVERSFVEPVDPVELQAHENKGAWCLEQHDVRFQRSLLARDRLRMLCIYQAPDAESVRLAQRTIGLPVERVWAAEELQRDSGANLLVVERQFEQPVTRSLATQMAERMAWCSEAYGVERVQSYLARDGHRAVCVFRAPDAEAVRTAHRKNDIPFGRVWPGDIVEP